MITNGEFYRWKATFLSAWRNHLLENVGVWSKDEIQGAKRVLDDLEKKMRLEP